MIITLITFNEGVDFVRFVQCLSLYPKVVTSMKKISKHQLKLKDGF